MTSNNEAQTVFVIDDDADVRDSLQWLLESVGLKVRTFEDALTFFLTRSMSSKVVVSSWTCVCPA